MDESGQNLVNIGSPAVEPTNSTHPIATPKEQQSSAGGDLRYAAGKPAAVWVFGVLNCIFGGLGLLLALAVFWGMAIDEFVETGINDENKMLTLFEAALWFCMSVWQVAMGIGLLRFRKWARRGSVIYAWTDIVWTLLVIVFDIITELMHWVSQSGADNAYESAEGMCLNLIGLIYPVLLLVFMQKAKVKEAFSAVGE